MKADQLPRTRQLRGWQVQHNEWVLGSGPAGEPLFLLVTYSTSWGEGDDRLVVLHHPGGGETKVYPSETVDVAVSPVEARAWNAGAR